MNSSIATEEGPFFKEYTFYTDDIIQKRLNIECRDKWNAVKKLLLDKILKEDERDGKSGYRFSFVGIFEVAGVVGYCFPKFFASDKASVNQIKMVVKVIEKYKNEKGQYSYLSDGENETSYSEVLTELFLYRDFLENGVYIKSFERIEDDGDGEIEWEPTINETTPLFKKKIPYYINLKTRETYQEEDLCSRIHRSIVTECSRRLSKMGLLDILDLNPIEVSDEKFDKEFSDFGGLEQVKRCLVAEIGIQFVTQKQIVLKTMLSFLQKENSRNVSDSIYLYGIRDFNAIWEHCCAKILDVILFDCVDEDDVLKSSVSDYKVLNTLLHCEWESYSKKKVNPSKGRLRPDILAKAEVASNENVFCIFDAKNYLIAYDEDEKAFQNCPGIPDVIKQFVYHKALLSYIANSGSDHVVNAFLFPKSPDSEDLDSKKNLQVEVFGEVRMPSITQFIYGTSDPSKDLVPINLIKLNYRAVFEAFLNGDKRMEMISEIWQMVKKIRKSKARAKKK